MAPPNTTKEKLKRDMAKARSLETPALAKKYMVVASRRPRPPIEMGKRVIAPTMGIKIKKYNKSIFNPRDKAMIKQLSGATA